MSLAQLVDSIGNRIADEHLIRVTLPVFRCRLGRHNDNDVHFFGQLGEQAPNVRCREVGIQLLRHKDHALPHRLRRRRHDRLAEVIRVRTEMRDDHTIVSERRRHVDSALGTPEGLNEVRCRKIGLDLQMLAADHAAALTQDLFEQWISELKLVIRAMFMQRLQDLRVARVPRPERTSMCARGSPASISRKRASL